jgi:hypothetical protein
MGGTSDGDRWLTSDSSESCSIVCPDLLLIRSDMGFLRFSLLFPLFCSGAVGAFTSLGAIEDVLSLTPFARDVCDLELVA